jgi:outer membrane protein OmpA-like peptidoglycan-associated protein
MSKRESPIGLIFILLATFGLSIASIWLAYQFGFGSNSDVEYTYEVDTNNTFVRDESSKSEVVNNNTTTPTFTPTPKKLKTADDIGQNPIQGEVKFLFDSNKITSVGVETLNQLEKNIVEFDPQTVGIRIFSNSGESEFSQEIARKRGEEIAGYLRHLGLKHKIVISKRSANPSTNNLSSQQKPWQPLVIELYKL